MKRSLLFLSLFILCAPALGAQFEGSISEWRGDGENFKKPEESFKKALQILKEKYADKNIGEEDLYRAATEGMLSALNHEGKENWNTLLSPRDLADKEIEMSGQLVGIGATLEFDSNSGNAKVRGVIPNSAADKEGLHKMDQILSVNGKRYKNLRDMVKDIRGKEGEKVKLKVLREDRILEFKIVRSAVHIPDSVVVPIDSQTGYLEINFFSTETLGHVKNKLQALQNKNLKKLIIDLRENHGGLFQQANQIAELFLKKGDIIVKTKSRDGEIKDIKASKDEAWSPTTQIIVLTDAATSSSGEVLAACLKENRQALIVGTKTAGKWSVESVESLPNAYAIKYSMMFLLSPLGKSYEGTGLPPDFEVSSKPVEADFLPSEFSKDIKTRIEKDPALKVAVGLPQR